MRHAYFQLPPAAKTANKMTALAGMEPGRLYAIVGLISIDQPSGKAQHCLTVVHNPFIAGDTRRIGDIWSKSFFKDTKRNQIMIDQIIERYGEAVYNFITDETNNIYIYDFMDIL